MSSLFCEWLHPGLQIVCHLQLNYHPSKSSWCPRSSGQELLSLAEPASRLHLFLVCARSRPWTGASLLRGAFEAASPCSQFQSSCLTIWFSSSWLRSELFPSKLFQTLWSLGQIQSSVCRTTPSIWCFPGRCAATKPHVGITLYTLWRPSPFQRVLWVCCGPDLDSAGRIRVWLFGCPPARLTEALLGPSQCLCLCCFGSCSGRACLTSECHCHTYAKSLNYCTFTCNLLLNLCLKSKKFEFWFLGVLGFWGFGVLGFWGFGVLWFRVRV